MDDECFRRVAEQMLRSSVEPSSWDAFPHVTDSGIVDSLWRRHLTRPPSPQERDAFIDAYERALDEELRAAPQRFAAVAGAANILTTLQDSGWHVAIATGGWSRTARLKLTAATLPSELLLASADDSHDRQIIFELARHRSECTRDVAYATVVLVGDGTWDVRTASQLGWPFLGVANNVATATKLGALGAPTIVPDYLDVMTVLGCLESLITLATS